MIVCLKGLCLLFNVTETHEIVVWAGVSTSKCINEKITKCRIDAKRLKARAQCVSKSFMIYSKSFNKEDFAFMIPSLTITTAIQTHFEFIRQRVIGVHQPEQSS
jgi:hypothetical protein